MSETAPVPQRPPILVVDDTPQNLSLMSDLLEEHYSVKLAPSGARALKIVATSPPSLILLDIMMPEMDGYAVCRELKANPASKDIPVIFVTAMSEIEDEEKGLTLGAVDYLSKPISPPILLARVRNQLALKSAGDALREQHQQLERLHEEVQSQATQLAEWNKGLEQRVQEQVAQLDRLGRLKAFFSPQLAESIVDGGGEDLLKTHRREVVVVFLDLRGFTAFTDRSEPEEVMSVLGEYHGVMGQLVVAHEGTLERFAGDGLMIFFNDPIKLENPTLNAVKMSLEMQVKFAPLRAAWKKRGFDLDLGIGIAPGYATLGAIGFEGRWDYACIGSVTNLAARLCGEAKGGQVLTNQKTLSRVEDVVQAEPLGEVMLKGITHPVQLFNIK